MAPLFPLALAAYGVAAGVALVRPARARGPLALGVFAHFVWLVLRGAAIGFLPLSNKMESFSAAAFLFAVVALVAFRPSRAFLLPLLGGAVGWGLLSSRFPGELQYPGPLLFTVWYPLHVPLTFLALALWTAAAGAGLAWLRERDAAWLAVVDKHALQGFATWSVAMVMGSVWGAVSWGAWFLWDPKMIWSVLLWFHYASFVHVKLAPSLAGRAWLRPALAWLGFAWLLVAYVGTSFFFGKSVHAF